MRLIFDPTLPDSARQLELSDFWDGLGGPSTGDKIVVSVEIREFDDDFDVLALLTDYRLDSDADTIRLTYEFRPKSALKHDPKAAADYEFVLYGGEDEAKYFGHELRRKITMDVLPALRDAEGDLATWRRLPLRPLIEEAFREVDQSDLEEIGQAVEAATAKITEFDRVKELEKDIGDLFSQMSGPHQDIGPRLGFAPTDPTRFYRNIRTIDSSGSIPSQRSSGNSAYVRGAEDEPLSSKTSIDLRQASSCEELISPRYNTCRCTTRPPATRRFSTMLQ